MYIDMVLDPVTDKSIKFPLLCVQIKLVCIILDDIICAVVLLP